MKKSTQLLGVLALLSSSSGFAATMTITSNVANVVPIGNFTITASADALFPANVIGGSLLLTWNAARVSLLSLIVSGVGSAIQVPGGATPTGPMDFASIDPGTGLFSVLNSSGPTPAGPYDLFTVTFTVLNNVLNQTSSGAANVFVSDVGQDGWIDDQFNTVPLTTLQANVVVGTNAVPVPAAAWLFVSALGGLAGLRRRHQ